MSGALLIPSVTNFTLPCHEVSSSPCGCYLLAIFFTRMAGIKCRRLHESSEFQKIQGILGMAYCPTSRELPLATPRIHSIWQSFNS
jgi:hypothetical protein